MSLQPRFRGFTLLEMLTTVAFLVVLLGLMVSLARDVRERSAQALTESVLRQLDAIMTRYADRNGGRVPDVSAFPPAGAAAPESAFTPRPNSQPSTRPRLVTAQRQDLLHAALANCRDIVGVLRRESSQADAVLAELPVSVFDATTIRDAWGSPVVFMPSMHPWVGTAPRDKPYFFFSAGPDRDYLTRDDNLYSYEEIVGGITRRRGE